MNYPLISYKIQRVQPIFSLLSTQEKRPKLASKIGAPKGIRIPVGSLKGCCPRPLDDGGTLIKYSRVRVGQQWSVCVLALLAPYPNPPRIMLQYNAYEDE